MSEPGTPSPSPDYIASLNAQIDRAIAQAAEWRHPSHDKPALQFMEPVLGPVVTLTDGRQIQDQWAWIESPAEPRAVFYAALHLLRGISEHGSGRVWWLAPTPTGKVVHLVDDKLRGGEVRKGPDDEDSVRLRTLYFHEAKSVAPLEEQIRDHVVQGHRAKEYRVHPRDLTDMAMRLGAKVTRTEGAPVAPLTMMLSCLGIPAHIVTDESVPPGTFACREIDSSPRERALIEHDASQPYLDRSPAAPLGTAP